MLNKYSLTNRLLNGSQDGGQRNPQPETAIFPCSFCSTELEQ
jgi:hypothetical protein